MQLVDLLDRLKITGEDSEQIAAQKAALAAIIMASKRVQEEAMPSVLSSSEAAELPANYVLQEIEKFRLLCMKLGTEKVKEEFWNLHSQGLFEIRFDEAGEYIHLSEKFRSEIVVNYL